MSMFIKSKCIQLIIASIFFMISIGSCYFFINKKPPGTGSGIHNQTSIESSKSPLQYYNGWEKDYLHLSQNEFTGNHVKVAVLDTRITASDLSLRTQFPEAGALTPRNTEADLHGDGIARVIMGVAPDIVLYNAVVANDEGLVKQESMIKGLEWAISQKADIVNMSISFNETNSRVDELLKQAYNEGIILVAAAGNDASETVSYPASSPYVISVGSSGIDGKRLAFSNYGKQVLFYSCGKYIKTGRDDRLSSFHQGTSISTAILSGIIARLKEETPELHQAALIERLKTMSRRTQKDEEYGYGIPTF